MTESGCPGEKIALKWMDAISARTMCKQQIRKQPKLDGCQLCVNPNKERAKGDCQGEKDGSSWMDASYVQILNKEMIKSG